jgi:hypothetical protein
MKTYVAQRPPDDELGECVVFVESAGNARPLHHVALHSQGFEWGYGGSGPADLALSILADHLGERPTKHQLHHGQAKSWRYHQAFKRAFISGADRRGFTITSEQIAAWLAKQQEGGESNR